jgi:hypothetical protein
LQQRLISLPGACAFAAGFIIYLGPYQFPFRRLMLTMHWIKCLRDRGFPLVLDYLSNLRGRIVTWQKDGMSNMILITKNVLLNGDDWRVNFESNPIETDQFSGNLKDTCYLTHFYYFII